MAAADLVLRAARPWSPRTHQLWPAAARAFVRELLQIGFRLHELGRIDTELWLRFVMPRLVRRCGPVLRSELDDEDAYEAPRAYRVWHPWRYHEPLVL